jgi:hypothetical protein
MQKTTYPRPTPRKHSRKRQTVHADSWMPQQLQTALLQIGKEEQLSLSCVIRSFCEAGVKQRLHEQHAVLLPAIIEAAIDKKMNRLIDKLADFFARSLFDTGQLKWLSVNLFYHDVLSPNKHWTQEEYYALLDTSRKEAVQAMKQWNPNITEAVAEIKKWLREEEKA